MTSREQNLPRARRHLTLPVMLIVLGVLFLVNQYVPQWGIGRTWPMILIALGILVLVASFLAPRPPRGPRV